MFAFGMGGTMRIALAACCVTLAGMMLPASATSLELVQRPAYALGQDGLSDATILIVRHAEKPASGPELSAAGAVRADAYAQYFEHFTLDGQPIHIDALVASEDTRKSSRPRLTLGPLSSDTGMSINQPCPDRAVGELVTWLKQRAPHQTTLVAWHHTKMAKLLAALGANPAAFLPGGRWPSDAFDWVVALRFDQEGHLIPSASRVIDEPAAMDDAVWAVATHPAIRPRTPN
jgi:hypothetical protein